MRVGIWLIKEHLQSGIKERQFACSECGWTSGFVTQDWKACPVCTARMFFTTHEMKQFLNSTEGKNGEAIRI